jgi:hypothetical protein
VLLTLSDYQQQTQRLIGDVDQSKWNLADLTIYINLARAQVAAEGQCVRFLVPSAASIASITPGALGSGYTTAQVAIGLPDIAGVTATATANIVGGEILSYNLTNPGSGYMFPPLVTVTGNGTGATATAVKNYTLTANTEQEVYNFKDVPIPTLFPGAQAILAVLSVAVIWQNVRYVGNRLSFSKYQALIRSYTSGNFLYTPYWFSQYGQGVNGSFYLYPLPDQVYPMEWDSLLIPADLVDDTSIELIPYPWTDAVPFWAAWLALLANGDPARSTLADRYYNPTNGGIYGVMMKRARAFSQPSLVSSFYGRNIS